MIKVDRAPHLKIGWSNAVLDTEALNRVILCFAMLPQPHDDRSKHEPFSHYLTALAFLAKTDVFLQFEIQAYVLLSPHCRLARLFMDSARKEDDFEAAFERMMNELIPEEAFRKKHLGVVKSYLSKSLAPGTITLSEAAEIKLICDAYFIHVFNELAVARATEAQR